MIPRATIANIGEISRPPVFEGGISRRNGRIRGSVILSMKRVTSRKRYLASGIHERIALMMIKSCRMSMTRLTIKTNMNVLYPK